MIVAPYEPNQKYDSVFKTIVTDVKQSIKEGDDDFLLLVIGSTGTGKSILGLHALDLYLEDKSSIDFVGLDIPSYAKALQQSATGPLPRFCMMDEANVSKRDSLSKYNKDLIDMFMAIRGKQIFHWWCNPSLEMIDKFFINERIKGLIFITTKSIDKPRIYYYFRKIDMLRIVKKYDKLTLPVLKSIRKDYAYYRGWFKDYSGPLKQEYAKKKNARMTFKIDDFFEKYGHEETVYLKPLDINKALGIHRNTLKNYTAEMLEKGLLTSEQVVKTETGRTQYTPDTVELFRKYAGEKRIIQKEKNKENYHKYLGNPNKENIS